MILLKYHAIESVSERNHCVVFHLLVVDDTNHMLCAGFLEYLTHEF